MKQGATLVRRLSGWQLWIVAVGMVISGQYFGWNQGFFQARVMSVLIALALVTVFYCGFMRLFVQLSSAMPRTGGVMCYLLELGCPRLSIVSGWAALVEYFFGAVAIAVAIGAYVHGMRPGLPGPWIGAAVLLCCIGLNGVGIDQSVRLESVATVLALLGIVIFVVFGFISHPRQPLHPYFNHGSWHGVAFAVPFVLWLYLGIEGSTLAAEEALDPVKQLPRAIALAMGVLVVGALCTVVEVALLLPSGARAVSNPLPAALSQVYSARSWVVQAVSVLGLFGLLASLNGLLIASSRQLYALSRAGAAPRSLVALNRVGAPYKVLVLFIIAGGLLLAFVPLTVLLRCSILGVLLVYAGGLLAWLLWSRRTKSGGAAGLKMVWVLVCGLCFFCMVCVLRSFY